MVHPEHPRVLRTLIGEPVRGGRVEGDAVAGFQDVPVETQFQRQFTSQHHTIFSPGMLMHRVSGRRPWRVPHLDEFHRFRARGEPLPLNATRERNRRPRAGSHHR